MRILAVDSSAKPASATIYEDGKILGDYYMNTAQTHSETLMPMIESLLCLTKLTVSDIDAFAVTNGPGSFTGVRIGVSCVKGLAFTNNAPCCPISTLEAIAYNATELEGRIICAVMDARREQVYNAVFRIEKGKPVRLCEDRAVMIEALRVDGEKYGSDMLLIGDGAELCYGKLHDTGVILAGEGMRYQKAASVAMAAAEKMSSGEKLISPRDLAPSYLRLPQAERELKEKQISEERI